MPPTTTDVRPKRALSLTLLIGGSACGVLGLVLFGVFILGGILGADVHNAPGRVTVACNSGTYYVFEQTGGQFSVPGFSYTHTGYTTLEPDQVLVVGPEGRRISTWPASGNETITKGSNIYTNAVGFTVPTAGNYSVTLRPSSPTKVIISASLGDQFLSAAPWLIFAVVGFPAALVGLILLIRESGRRKRTGAHGPIGWQGA